MPKFLIYSDGGSRGNPGPGAFGFVIKTKGVFSFQFLVLKQTPNFDAKIQNNIIYGSGFLGTVTNNQAEYQGILTALKYFNLIAKSQKLIAIEIECFLDSQLIVEQMNGNYKIKNEGLKPLYWQIRELILELGGRVTFSHIPREQNAEADKLVNEAIDKATC